MFDIVCSDIRIEHTGLPSVATYHMASVAAALENARRTLDSSPATTMVIINDGTFVYTITQHS